LGGFLFLQEQIQDIIILAYPAHGVKATIMRRKATDLMWAPNKTTVEIHSAVMEYYEAYDRAVVQTQGMADVTMIVPAQDLVTRFTELQGMFPPWALALITNFPDRFTNMANCWTANIAETSRQAAGRKMGTGGRVLQLAADTMPAVELDGINAAGHGRAEGHGCRECGCCTAGSTVPRFTSTSFNMQSAWCYCNARRASKIPTRSDDERASPPLQSSPLCLKKKNIF
jgi:hypothetical protein